MKLFVYGSLLDPVSAERALHRYTSAADLLPVRLPGYCLSWDSIHTIHADSLGRETPASFLNLQADSSGQCLGALIEINPEELARLIQREKGYALTAVCCTTAAGQAVDAITFIDERRPPAPLPPAPAGYLEKIRRGLATMATEFAAAYLAELPPPPQPLLTGNYHFVDSGQRAST